MGRHTRNGRGSPIIVFTPVEYSLTLKIFNNYGLGLVNEKAFKEINANYRLHLHMKDQIIFEKEIQIKALSERIEFGNKVYKLVKDEIKSTKRRNTVTIVIAGAGGLGIGILAGFLIGAFAS